MALVKLAGSMEPLAAVHFSKGGGAPLLIWRIVISLDILLQRLKVLLWFLKTP